MRNSTNYSLLLPDESDSYSVNDMNANTEFIDAQMKKVENEAANGTKAANDLQTHIANKSNPHGVTKEQVGLGNVPNVSTNNQAPTYTVPSSLSAMSSGEVLSTAFGKLAKAVSDLISHIGNKSNPHGVTKSQIGLGSVENTSDANKPVSTAQATAIADAKAAGTTAQSNLNTHVSTKTNPHEVTKSQVGLGNCDNTSDANKPVSTAQQAALNSKVDKVTGMGLSTNDYTTAEKTKLAGIATGAQVNTITGIKGSAETTYRTGQVNITAANIGLGNVNNTADSAKSVLYAATAGGVAWGSVTGKPSTYAPSTHTHDDRYYTETEVNNLLEQRVHVGSFANKRLSLQWVDSTSELKAFIDNVEIGNVMISKG